MRIGIDIDGVLTNVERFSIDYLTKYCVENNINFNVGNSNYSVHKAFNISKEQEDNFWKEYLEHYSIYEKARPFAADVVQKLNKEGHEIYIITARWLTNRDDKLGEHMRQLVKNWLLENNIYYDKLIFSKAENENKYQEVKEHNIDIMIEDNPNNIIELSKSIPIICYDAEYNRNCEGTNITRCYSWYDIYRTFK